MFLNSNKYIVYHNLINGNINDKIQARSGGVCMDFLVSAGKMKSSDSREIFATAFELLNIAEGSKRSYEKIVQNNSSETNLAKHLIYLYYEYFETNYESMIYNFKKKYIENEARVEYNNENLKDELIGLGYMYDYIQNYKPSEGEFNIFIEIMKLHSLLYKASDDRLRKEREEQREEYKRELEDAKKNKDLKEYRRINDLLKSFSDTNQSFGGTLRKDDVELKGIDYHPPSAKDAMIFLNSFITPAKIVEYHNILSSSDIFGYIEYCVKIYVDIIKNQPFANGNKRASRALLNLMFKNKNIPPVYIVKNERKPYKDALIKAIEKGDYTDIINFYYFKICDSIYELDILPYINSNKMNKQSTEQAKRIISYRKRINEVAEKEKDGVEEPDDSDMKFYDFHRKN